MFSIGDTVGLNESDVSYYAAGKEAYYMTYFVWDTDVEERSIGGEVDVISLCIAEHSIDELLNKERRVTANHVLCSHFRSKKGLLTERRREREGRL